MRIAIDLSPLQSGHRMRGVGSVIINFINNISDSDKKKHTFVFYVVDMQNDKYGDPLEAITTEGLNFEVKLGQEKQQAQTGRLQRVLGKLGKFISIYSNDSRLDTIGEVDVFLQFDQLDSLPRSRKVKKALVMYDLIPYILEHDYLWSYKTARHMGYSRKASLKCEVRRYLYLHKIKVNARRADYLLAISKYTKDDLLKYTRVKQEKIKVTPLGITPKNTANSSVHQTYQRYLETSWGYLPKSYHLPEEQDFLLFVGGADHRRKLDHLVTAFNHLRAEGRDIKLILAGDIMQGPLNIPTMDIQTTLSKSSYLDDIVFMGFVTESVRESLYARALAFVYPSMYEGFGLPILEAMQHGTPVITYRNSSIAEVAGSAAIYAKDFRDIITCTKQLMDEPEIIKKYNYLGKKQTEKYSWKRTADNIIKLLG